MEPLEQKVQELRKLEKGTLGREVAECLDTNSLRLVAGFESHDLKHVLLDYKMTPKDEIRMQAFMLGNGNYTFPCFAILGFGMVLLPWLWQEFLKDFIHGRNAVPLSGWTLEDYGSKNVEELREMIYVRKIKTNSLSMSTIIKTAAYTAMFAGVFGMIVCFPFLFSSNIADLVGAGFPFVGGAILAASGLIALSNTVKQRATLQ